MRFRIRNKLGSVINLCDRILQVKLNICRVDCALRDTSACYDAVIRQRIAVGIKQRIVVGIRNGTRNRRILNLVCACVCICRKRSLINFSVVCIYLSYIKSLTIDNSLTIMNDRIPVLQRNISCHHVSCLNTSSGSGHSVVLLGYSVSSNDIQLALVDSAFSLHRAVEDIVTGA